MNIAANKDEQWVTLARHLGRDDLLDHPDYATRELRKKNRLALREALEQTLKARPAEDWANALNRIGVPAGAMLTLPQILASSQVADRRMLGTFPDAEGVGRDITVVRTGVTFDGKAPAVDTPPPPLGAHNAKIFGGLGLSAAELDCLAQNGAI